MGRVQVFTAITTKVEGALVVCVDDDDVWLCVSGKCQRAEQEREEDEKLLGCEVDPA